MVIAIHKAQKNLCAGHNVSNYGIEEMVTDTTGECIKKALYTYAGKQGQALQWNHESERTHNPH